MLRRLLPALLAVSLTACSTFDDRELAGLRSQRVSPPVYSKLSRGEPIEPADVIELTRRGVAPSLIVRQIEDHGVASLISRSDVTKLRNAGVSPAVIDAMLRASDEFVRDHAPASGSVFVDSYDPYYGYSDPWPYHGGVSFGISSRRSHFGHHGRHWHH